MSRCGIKGVVLRRQVRGRIRLTILDRLFLVQVCRWFPSILKVLAIVQSETVICWHWAGFRCYWRWKSRARGGRPAIEADLRALIRQISIGNPLWDAPRIHGELVNLGFEVAKSRWPNAWSSDGGRPVRDGAPFCATMPRKSQPVGFSLVYAFVIVRLGRRALVWINVTRKSTAEWVARQLTEAFPWDETPGYLIRDNDHIYGDVTLHRIRAMGIRDKPIVPGRTVWLNG